jgi:hypothetical protein
VRGATRRAVLNRFPCAIYFRETDSEIMPRGQAARSSWPSTGGRIPRAGGREASPAQPEPDPVRSSLPRLDACFKVWKSHRGAGVGRGRPDGRGGRQELDLAHQALSVDPGMPGLRRAQALSHFGLHARHDQGRLKTPSLREGHRLAADEAISPSFRHATARYAAAGEPGYSKAFAMDVPRGQASRSSPTSAPTSTPSAKWSRQC